MSCGGTVLTIFQAFVKRTFPIRKPQFLFYDNNCTLCKHMNAQHDHSLDDTGRPVDNFHFECKHSRTDTFCVGSCDPKLFPELRHADGSWRFNSSKAEQTNVWLGGYHSICREMASDKFEFFLDEMIMRKNTLVVASLRDKGHLPAHYPDLVFPGPDVTSAT